MNTKPINKVGYYGSIENHTAKMFGVYNHGDLVLARTLRRDAIIAIEQQTSMAWDKLKRFMVIRDVQVLARW